MGLKTRTGSPYWIVELEGTKGPDRPHNIRLTTKIRHTGATPEQTAALELEAKYFYNEQMRDVNRARMGLPPITVEPKKVAPLLRDQADWHWTHFAAAHKGSAREKFIYARLKQSFGHLRLNEVTQTVWAEYVTQRLAEGVIMTTIRRELSILKIIIGSAVGEHLEEHPLEDVIIKKKKTLKAKRTLNAREEQAMAHALEAIDPELRDLYLVGVGTLLRRETLVQLRRSEHRGDRLVVDTKTGPHKVPLLGPTPLQQRAARILEARTPEDPDGCYFPRWAKVFADPTKEKGHASELFLKKVRRAARYAGVAWGLKNDGVVWHTMTRASGATRMMRDYQIDVRRVQLVGGWASLDQMMQYLGVDYEDLFSPIVIAPGEELPIEAPPGTPRVQSGNRPRKNANSLKESA